MALTQINSNSIADGSITNADISSSAAIDESKLTITSVGGANGVDFNDNVKARFGADDDLEIYHDGDNSYVHDNGTGELRLNSGNAVRIRKHDNETMALFNADGAATLYYNNVGKIATKSDGIDVVGEVQCDSLDVDGAVDITGNVTLHANLDLQDNDQIRLGTDNDLRIYHNGSHSVIDTAGSASGNLYIDQLRDDADIVLRSDNGSGSVSDYIVCDGSQGAVRLYNYGSQKLATTSTGVTVTGTVTATTFSGSGASLTNTGGLKSVQVFTASGTWTKPSGINRIKVTVTGGGGGGAGGSHNNNGGGGGGAGGTAIEVIDVSSVSSVTVTVGAGGTAGASNNGNAGAGGTSSFGTYCSANGGGAGIGWNNSGISGQGGTATGGNINITGGDGSQPHPHDAADDGHNNCGGASFWGGGGQGAFGSAGYTRSNQSYAVARAGKAYGSGGGGGLDDGSNVSPGAAGKAGVVYIEEFA